MKNKFFIVSFLILVSIFLTQNSSLAAEPALYNIDAYGGFLMKIDQDTFQTTETIALTGDMGETIQGANGTSVDPVTGYVYSIIRISSSTSRFLATVDISNGSVHIIGDLEDNFSALSFDESGNLYGLTGDGATTPSSLYSINKASAQKTLVASYNSNFDGESLAYNFENNLLYRATGSDMYAIDPENPESPTTIYEGNLNISWSSTGLLHKDGNYFYLVEYDSIYVVDISDGSFLTTGTLDASSKGVFFYPPSSVLMAIGYDPEINTINVPLNYDLSISFNGEVQMGTGNIYIKRVFDDSVFEQFSVSDPNITGWGSQSITIDPSVDFESETEYYIEIEDTAIKGSNENYFEGINDNTTWKFYTKPQGVSYSFEDNFISDDLVDQYDLELDTTLSQVRLRYMEWHSLLGEDKPSDNISDDNYHSYFPKIAINDSGIAVVAWINSDGTDERTYASIWNGSSWSEVQAFPEVNYYSGPPQVAINGDGEAVVVWSNSDGIDDEIYASIWNGTSWGVVQNISNDAYNSQTPKVAMDSNGNAIAIWRNHDGVDYEVQVSVWNGSSWGSIQNLSNDNYIAFSPEIVISENGSALAVWSNFDGSDYEIYASIWNGISWSTVQNISNDGYDSDFPHLAIDSSGNATVVWKNHDGTDDEIYASIWNGSSWSSYQNISNDNYLSREPKVGMDSNGNAMAVWWNFVETNYEIYVSAWNGSSWSVPQNISNDNNGSVQSQIEMDSSGNAVALWETYYDTEDSEVHASICDGNYWSSVQMVSSDDNDHFAEYPRVSMNDNGNIISTWSSSDGTDEEILVATYDPTYQDIGTIQSKIISGLLDDNIVRATLSADDETPDTSRIEYYLSNNAGTDWFEVQSGEEVTFSTEGSELQWKAILYEGSTPVLNSINIEYFTFSPEVPTPPTPTITEQEECTQEIDLTSVQNLTQTTADLKVETTCLKNEDADFKVRIENLDTNEESTIKISEKIDSDETNTLTIENLSPATTYRFKVKYSEEDKDDYSEYSDSKKATTLEEENTFSYISETPISEEVPTAEETQTETIIQDPASLQDRPQEQFQENIAESPAKTTIEKQKSFFTKIARSPFAFMGIVLGVITGASVALASSSVPLFSTSAQPIKDNFSRFFTLIGVLGKPKRKSEWGVVFDLETRRPIEGAVVSIINEAGHVVDTNVTDIEGRYGFLATKGLYKLSIAKKNYELYIQKESDEFYGDLYSGKPISVGENGIVSINIAMECGNIDWKNFAKNKIDSYVSVLSILKKDFFIAIFYVGFIVTCAITYFSPIVLNFALLMTYIALLIFQLFFKKRVYGSIVEKDGKPLAFAQISVYENDIDEKRSGFAVSDVIGRYKLLIKDGVYIMKISGMKYDGENFSKNIRVYARDGIINEKIVV